MKEAIVAKGPKVTIHDVPIPKPGTSQVLIKVVSLVPIPKIGRDLKSEILTTLAMTLLESSRLLAMGFLNSRKGIGLLRFTR
jgi:hypothetical protein